ncbi:MAG: hypothetical protein AAF570_27245, partial [Bacteroidota bacterium]
DAFGAALLIVLILEGILRAICVYLVMFDNRVNEFLIAQRAKNFGQRVRIAPENASEADSGASREKARPKKKPEAEEDKWDAVDDLYED